MIDIPSLDSLEKGRTGPMFQSKKNRVFRSTVAGESYVVKVYRGEWRERAAVEHGILVACRDRGVPVPEPLALLPGVIVMAPVEGRIAGDVFDCLFAACRGDVLGSEQERLADLLVRWLASFHEAFGYGLARGDTILRNFIVTERGAVGLDFEEAARGDTLSDLGQLCASAMMADPAFTGAKIAFARRLADRYWAVSGQRRMGELDGAVTAAIRHYAQFRPNGKALLAHADRIERGEVVVSSSEEL
ncbi:MAG: phosphotransferase [Candidatus Thermoplasmatota archaeon]